jgi:hypothetical protein
VKKEKADDRVYIQVYPKTKTWTERLTIIFYTLFGWEYHHWVTVENWKKALKK